MLYGVIFIIGLLIGLFLGNILSEEKPIGTLRMDQSDPDEKPYLFLELSKETDFLKDKKRVTLDVNIENYISQK